MDGLVEEDGLLYDPITGRMFKELNVSYEDNTGAVRPIRYWFKGKYRPSVRIIFYLMTGSFGTLECIDHIDNNPWNNAWNNLREATRGQNSRNRQPIGGFYTNGLEPGVSKTPGGRYRVRISRTEVGRFNTAEEANTAARAARKELHGEFAYTGGQSDD